MAGKVQLFSEGHKNLSNFLFDSNWLLTSLFTVSQSKLEDHVKLSKIEEKPDILSEVNLSELSFRFEWS